MELCDGSRNITMVVTNSTAYPQTLRKKTPVTKAVTVTWVPEPPMQTSIMEMVEGHKASQHQSWLQNKSRKTVQGVGFVSTGILATQAGRFCTVSLGWIPCLLPRTQLTWLYSLNWTCDQSHQQYPIQRMIQTNSPTIGGRGLYTLARNVGLRHDPPQPECMV